jgi:hypothetical protein
MGFEESWLLPWSALQMEEIARAAEGLAERARANLEILFVSDDATLIARAKAASTVPLPNESVALLQSSHALLGEHLTDGCVRLVYTFPRARRIEVCEALWPNATATHRAPWAQNFAPPLGGGSTYTVALEILFDSDDEGVEGVVLRLAANDEDNREAIDVAVGLRNQLAEAWKPKN